MRAAFLAVGSELLGSQRVDSNSLRVAECLERFGMRLIRKSVVGDEEAGLAAELRELVGRFELVVVGGGLGPTADDVTRQAVARALGRELVLDPAVLADIEEKFRSFGRRMPEVNRRQAFVVEGSEVLPNRRGTAPGLRLEAGESTVFLLPGVPAELAALLDSAVEPWLAARQGEEGVSVAVLKVACLPESEVEERLQPAYRELGREGIAILARPGEVRVELSSRGRRGGRDRRLEAMRQRVAALLSPALYAEGAEATLEATVGELLRERGERVATGESCTGGMVAQRLTAIPGSSDYFEGSVVAYSNRIKVALLAVPETELAAHGAVSRPVAEALARGARGTIGTDWGVGVTGVAGPSGGTQEKPVGTVHLAVSGPGEEDIAHLVFRFPGDRDRVRVQAAQLALEMLRRRLLGLGFDDLLALRLEEVF